MAKKTNKKSSGGKTGRAKPLVAKAGVTVNGKRRYCGGGPMKK
jgi:hypothetical protein